MALVTELGICESGYYMTNVTPHEKESGCINWRPVLYECECCERMTCTGKSKGIGYVCDPCLPHYEEDYASCRKLADQGS